MRFRRSVFVFVAAMVIAIGVPLAAHEMTVKGTVTAIEETRIQVKAAEDKHGATPAWYPIDARTKIKRGKKTVTLAEAKIAVEERVVLIVEHPDRGPMKTKEIRLANIN